jgi:hypothetical protein
MFLSGQVVTQFELPGYVPAELLEREKTVNIHSKRPFTDVEITLPIRKPEDFDQFLRNLYDEDFFQRMVRYFAPTKIIYISTLRTNCPPNYLPFHLKSSILGFLRIGLGIKHTKYKIPTKTA